MDAGEGGETRAQRRHLVVPLLDPNDRAEPAFGFKAWTSLKGRCAPGWEVRVATEDSSKTLVMHHRSVESTAEELLALFEG